MEHLRSIKVDGFDCCYRAFPAQKHPETHRPPIFFVGGAFQNRESWRRLTEALGSDWPVIVADLPGSGDAGRLPYRHSLDVLTDAMAAVLDDLGEPQAYVISASYGSAVAYRFAQRYSCRVYRLVLSGVMKEIPKLWREAVQGSVDFAERGDLKALCDVAALSLLRSDPAKPVRRGKFAERVLRSGLQAMTPEARVQYVDNTRRLLREPPLDLSHPPTVPTLVLTGEHDGFTPPEACLEVAQAIPNCWFTTIREADHLFTLEQFDAAVRLFLNFGEGEVPYEDPDLTPWRRSSVRAAVPTLPLWTWKPSPQFEPHAGGPNRPPRLGLQACPA